MRACTHLACPLHSALPPGTLGGCTTHTDHPIHAQLIPAEAAGYNEYTALFHDGDAAPAARVQALLLQDTTRAAPVAHNNRRRPWLMPSAGAGATAAGASVTPAAPTGQIGGRQGASRRGKLATVMLDSSFTSSWPDRASEMPCVSW